MVGLFEQWETEQQQKNPEKRISKKVIKCDPGAQAGVYL